MGEVLGQVFYPLFYCAIFLFLVDLQVFFVYSEYKSFVGCIGHIYSDLVILRVLQQCQHRVGPIVTCMPEPVNSYARIGETVYGLMAVTGFRIWVPKRGKQDLKGKGPECRLHSKFTTPGLMFQAADIQT